MQREIKFRAWDGEKMHTVGALTFNADGETGLVVDDWDWVKIDKPILMQYTCLKDKNGKKIYEGDILQARNFLGKDMGIYTVVWDGRGWHYQRAKNEWVYFASEMVEVIGNIYEHQELLK